MTDARNNILIGNIMDYKKKYEEALESLKKIRNANENNKELVDFIEYNYPELKESEDEMVRKWLIKAMKYLSEESTFFLEVPKNKVIAWLEKQGEQIDIVNKEYWRGYREGKQEVLDKYTELEKQGEQKPADKVEPKFKVGNIIRLKGSMAEYTIESISGECYHGKGWGLPIGYEEDYELVVQNLAWSEEDEKMWSTISDLLWEGFKLSDGKVSWDKIRCWLLPKITYFTDRVQPQSKQEWSEEDEMMLETVLDKIGDLGTGEMCKEWIKSLKERLKGE